MSPRGRVHIMSLREMPGPFVSVSGATTVFAEGARIGNGPLVGRPSVEREKLIADCEQKLTVRSWKLRFKKKTGNIMEQTRQRAIQKCRRSK